MTQTHKREVGSVVAQEAGEDSLSLHALLLLKHVAIHEAIHHGGVSMYINVELQTHFLQHTHTEISTDEKYSWRNFMRIDSGTQASM